MDLKDLKIKRIEPAPQHSIEALRPYVDRIMEAICDVVGISGGCFVSDESWLSDFMADDELYSALKDRLGLEVDPKNDDDNVIVKLAYKLKLRDTSGVA